uniref:Uncharacterized protein n=1 Tax=Opuntia streptacantha TaxID=393608 RepID=A0A7C9DMU8_OPUST
MILLLKHWNYFVITQQVKFRCSTSSTSNPHCLGLTVAIYLFNAHLLSTFSMPRSTAMNILFELKLLVKNWMLPFFSTCVDSRVCFSLTFLAGTSLYFGHGFNFALLEWFNKVLTISKYSLHRLLPCFLCLSAWQTPLNLNPCW